MDRLLRDLRYAVRRMLRSPGFTAVAILSLAIGIGANTAIFTMVNDVLFSHPPYARPDRLVNIYPTQDGKAGLLALSYPEFEDIRDGTSDVFQSVGAVSVAVVQENLAEGSETLLAEVVTGNWFDVLGIPPVVGRGFLSEEDQSPGARPVVVLGYDYWQRRFGGDPGAVGRTIRLNGKPYTVVGVASPDMPAMVPGTAPAVWAPIMMTNHLNQATSDYLTNRGNHNLFAKGRLAEGVTVEQSRAVLGAVMSRMLEEHADYYPDDMGLTAVPSTKVAIHPLLDRVMYPAAGVLMAVVGMILLIACVNLASFLLARAEDRRKEVALRLALGAGRGTLVRQLLTETVLLSLVGGGVGVGLALWGLRLVSAVRIPTPVPMDMTMTPDLRVLGFTLVITVAAGFFFGLFPAIQSTKPDVAPTLKDESVVGGGGRRLSLRNLLVVGQVTVSFVLLIGASLFLRSLQSARSVDPGFGRKPTAIAWLGLSPDRYDAEASRRFYDELLDRVRALPEVRAAGAVDNLALNGTSFTSRTINVPGVEPPPDREGWNIDAVVVDPGYFEAAGVPLAAGRDFGREDEADGQPVMIVSQAFVDRFFPDGDAVGQTVNASSGTDYRIVGVARNTNVRTLGETPIPYMYFPLSQSYRPTLQILARTGGKEPAALAREIARTAREMDPDVMIVQTTTMAEHLGFMLFPFRLGGMLLGVMGSLALLLAAVGLYGVVSYSAASRTREVGIRMSLGARSREVVAMVMKGGMSLVAVGTALGLVLAFLASRVLASLLFKVEPGDPVAFAGVTVLLVVVAAAASLIPALRASRVDPVEALRRQ